MKRKTCLICKKKLKTVQQLFCSNECYDVGLVEVKKTLEYLRQEKEVLKKLHDNVEIETEILYAKKQNLILKESVGYNSPFTNEYKKKIYELVE